MLGTKSALGVVSRAAALCSAPAQHNAALRAGWNDAAWGQPRREMETAVAPWYERGYAGGLVFRQKREQGHISAGVMGWVPRVVRAG